MAQMRTGSGETPAGPRGMVVPMMVLLLAVPAHAEASVPLPDALPHQASSGSPATDAPPVPAPSPDSTIRGQVVLQGWGEPVVGAEVLVMTEEMEVVESTATREEGVFSVVVPDGTYFVQANREGNFSELSEAIEVEDGRVQPDEIVLLFPSALFQMAADCFAEDGDAAAVRGVMVGVVFDGQTGMVLPESRLVLQWDDDEEGGVEAGRAEVETDDRGYYAFCGLPPDVDLTVWGYAMGHVSQPGEGLVLEEGSITRTDLELDLAFGEATIQFLGVDEEGREDDGPGILSGRLVDRESGRAITSAMVRLVERGRETTTDEGGRFAFDELESGEYTLEVEHLSYGTQQIEVSLPVGSDVMMELAVAPQVLALEGVEVTARSRRLEMERATPVSTRVTAGAEMRQAEIRGATVSSVVTGFTGLRVRSFERALGQPPSLCIESARTIRSFRDGGSCRMITVYVDGMRIPDADQYLIDLQVQDFESIEYLSPTEAGVQYGLDASSTGVLVLWTRGRGPHVDESRDRP